MTESIDDMEAKQRNKVVTQTRYRYETVPITKSEAKAERRREIEHIQNQISALQRELKELISAPLRSERVKQISLEPGDPGYEDAPLGIDVKNYQGDFAWVKSRRQ